MNSFKKNIYRTAIEDSCPDCVANDVTIGTQTWTGCNLDVDTYRNGDPIPYVSNSTIWASLTTGAWCWYNNDPTNETTYGKLYNWHAINDPRGLAPTGYHIPTDAEWTILTNYLGGLTVAGGKMKEEGLCHWDSPNTSATNTSLFTGLPGGYRNANGNYGTLNSNGDWWSSTVYSTGFAWFRYLVYNDGTAYSGGYPNETGLSVRLIKDADPCPECSTHLVTIGAQTWTGCNANTKFYNNGDGIPEVTDPIAWITLTTGAWCYYNNDPSTEATYGLLYNWYAITDPRGIAPAGYHVPSYTEWTTLITTLGGAGIAGGPMKETGLCHWATPNTGATNTSLFTGLPGGYRVETGAFSEIGLSSNMWSSTVYGTGAGWYSRLRYSNDDAPLIGTSMINGLSLRFVQD